MGVWLELQSQLPSCTVVRLLICVSESVSRLQAVCCMAFPSEIVGPICNAFLLRTEKLLVSPKPIISKIHYGVLTLKLLIENNEPAAVHHISLAVTEQCSNFLKAVFEFLSRGET